MSAKIVPLSSTTPEPILDSRPTTTAGGSRTAYYLFHPYFRLSVAVLLPVCNFILYAEDPIVHSYCEAELNVGGQALTFVATKYPSAGGIAFLKVLFWVISLITGVLVGKLVIHHIILRDVLKISCCGWAHRDDDDLKEASLHNPFKTNNPQNRIWWQQSTENAHLTEMELFPDEFRIETEDVETEKDHKKSLQDAFRKGVICATNGGAVSEFNKQVLQITGTQDTQKWWSRKEYLESEQTYLEIIFPFLFHPRKHTDHSKGTIIVTFCTVLCTLTLGSLIYNTLVLANYYNDKSVAVNGVKIPTADEMEYEKLKISSSLGVNEWEFGKFAAVISWLADFLNLLVTIDSVLQEISRHVDTITSEDIITPAYETHIKNNLFSRHSDTDPFSLSEPMPRLKLGYLLCLNKTAAFWTKKKLLGIKVRILIFWLLFLGSMGAVMIAVVGDAAKWDKWQTDLNLDYGTTENFRLLLSSAIVIQGILTVVQDWEFPGFQGVENVNLPGLDTDAITFCDYQLCKINIAKRNTSVPFSTLYITNKWLTFIPFVLTLYLDFNMLQGLYEYDPGMYGQYTNPANDQVCSTRNETYAELVKTTWEQSKINIANYTIREEMGFLNANSTDFCMPCKFVGSSKGIKLLIALPGLLAYVFFAYCFIKYTRLDKRLGVL